MNIKRLLSLFLVCVMLLSVLASCKKEAKGGADSALEDASSELIREESAVPQEESGEESLEESKGTEESNEEKTMPTGHTPLNYEYMKGIWLYQYSAECLFRSGGKQRDEADYTRLVEQICSNLERDGYNTLFLQVRDLFSVLSSETTAARWCWFEVIKLLFACLLRNWTVMMKVCKESQSRHRKIVFLGIF